MSDTPELDALLGPDVWCRDASGATVHRGELIGRIKRESLTELVGALQTDTRKSISKKKIIEMIEEYL